MKYRFHFSFKDHRINDKFLRGQNIYLETDNMVHAIWKFREEHPDCEIMGVLKTLEE